MVRRVIQRASQDLCVELQYLDIDTGQILFLDDAPHGRVVYRTEAEFTGDFTSRHGAFFDHIERRQ